MENESHAGFNVIMTWLTRYRLKSCLCGQDRTWRTSSRWNVNWSNDWHDRNVTWKWIAFAPFVADYELLPSSCFFVVLLATYEEQLTCIFLWENNDLGIFLISHSFRLWHNNYTPGYHLSCGHLIPGRNSFSVLPDGTTPEMFPLLSPFSS